jgi:hypothetical protein
MASSITHGHQQTPPHQGRTVRKEAALLVATIVIAATVIVIAAILPALQHN